jgi:hypothetical protein
MAGLVLVPEIMVVVVVVVRAALAPLALRLREATAAPD